MRLKSNEIRILHNYFFKTIRDFWVGIINRIRAVESSNVISADGAVPLNYECHRISTAGAALAGTLADGTDGQYMTFVMEARTGGNDYVLTPDNLGDYGGGAKTTITFAAVGQSVQLVFINDKWYIVGTPTATPA